jgi:hypothetical protein
MKFAGNMLIASLVICFASFALASSSPGGSGAGGTNVPITVPNVINSPRGICTGDFAHGTGVCRLYEIYGEPNESGPTGFDINGSIDLHAPGGTVGLGPVQIREFPFGSSAPTSDALNFTEGFNSQGQFTTFVSWLSDPNIPPFTFRAFANENLGPCNPDCSIAVYAPGGIGTNNTYWVYSDVAPEPGTLALLGSGLLGALGMARRRLFH